jgi:hypothetical protein
MSVAADLNANRGMKGLAASGARLAALIEK